MMAGPDFLPLAGRLVAGTTEPEWRTAVSRAYYAAFHVARRLLEDLGEAEDAVGRMQAAPRGTLKVNAPMSFGIQHLAPVLPVFLERYPEIAVELNMNDRFVDLVDEGFDMAVRIGKLEDSSLVTRKLAPARRTISAAPAYLQTRGVPASPDDLTAHECLCYSNVGLWQEWRFVRPDGRPWPVEVRGRLHANNGDALRAAALRGFGLAVLPSFLVGRDFQSGALVSVLEAFMPQDSALYAVYPHARHLSPKVRAFVDFLAERFGPDPYWDRPEGAGGP